MVDVRADVKGLKELRKALKTLDLQKGLQQANKRVVNDVVVPEARRLGQRPAPNLAGGVSRLGTRGLKSIRGSATQTKAFILAGTKAVPWVAGFDFGSSGRYRQFPRAQKGGRVLYKAIENKNDELIGTYMDAIDELTREAFPD